MSRSPCWTLASEEFPVDTHILETVVRQDLGVNDNQPTPAKRNWCHHFRNEHGKSSFIMDTGQHLGCGQTLLSSINNVKGKGRIMELCCSLCGQQLKLDTSSFGLLLFAARVQLLVIQGMIPNDRDVWVKCPCWQCHPGLCVSHDRGRKARTEQISIHLRKQCTLWGANAK